MWPCEEHGIDKKPPMRSVWGFDIEETEIDVDEVCAGQAEHEQNWTF